MRIIIVGFVSMFFVFLVQAQQKYFNKIYGWADVNSARKVHQNADGGLSVIGNYLTYNVEPWHGYFLRTNQYGDTLLLRTFPEFGDSYFGSLLPTDYGYAISGYIYQDVTNEYSYHGFLLQVDENGNQLQFDYTGAPADTMPSYIYDLIRTPDNGYLLAGHKINEWVFPYYWKFYLVKLNQNGQTEWERIYDNYTYSNLFSRIVPADDGGYILWGSANIKLLAGEQESDVILMKVDEQGIMQWDSIYSFHPQITAASDMIKTASGNLIALVGTGFPNLTDQIIVKFSQTGEILMYKEFPDIKCSLSGAIELPNGELVFTNCYAPDDGNTDSDMAIFKLSANGNLRWWRRYGVPAHNDYGYDIILAQDGGFIVAGRQDTTGGASVWLVHTNCMGLLTQPAAAFSYQPQATPNLMKFINQSQFVYADSTDGGKYIWTWGDGSPPNTFTTESFTEVYHYYPAPGSYLVTLTAIVCTDTSTVQAVIDTEGAGGTVGITPPQPPRAIGASPLASEGGSFEVAVYPNPAQNTLTLANWQNMDTFKLYAISGVQVLGYSPVSGSQIGIAQLPAGLYIAEAQYKNGTTQRQKLLIHR